jgi:hypothetical protein
MKKRIIKKKPSTKKLKKPFTKKLKKSRRKYKDHLFGKTCYKSQIKPKKVKKSTSSKRIEVPVVKKEEVGVRGHKKSCDKMYFTQDTQNAIVLYNKTEDIDIREKIFQDKIKYPFEKLVENIFNTFKFSYFETSPLDVQKETVSHLVANIHKYNPIKGKAFAYFSIVAKHYLIFLNNSNYKRFNQHQEISEDRENHTIQLQSEDKYYKQYEISEFMKLIIDYWESNVGKIFLKQKDLNIANAVIELFRNSDRIDAFNKKALYLYIREISNCKTQQITKVINKMKQCHVNITKSYLNTGTVVNTPSFSKA